MGVDSPAGPVTYDLTGVTPMGGIGQQKTSPYNGPQPGVDLNEGDEVEVLSHGRPTGMRGKIFSFEGSQGGKPMARVHIQGIPGGDLVACDELRKVASLDREAIFNLRWGKPPEQGPDLDRWRVVPHEVPDEGGGWQRKQYPKDPMRPGIDFQEGEQVKIKGFDILGRIIRFDGVLNGKQMATVLTPGSGHRLVALDELEKLLDTRVAQFVGNGPGRPQTDPFVMPDIGETQGKAQKRNTPALQKTCHVCGATNAPDAMNCVNCGTSLKNPYTVPRQPTQKAAKAVGKGQYMTNPPHNRNVRGPTTETFERRVKRPSPPFLPSDEFADIGDEKHMEEVRGSAEALGID